MWSKGVGEEIDHFVNKIKNKEIFKGGNLNVQI